MDYIEGMLTWLLERLIDAVRAWFWRDQEDEAITELMHWLEVDA